MTVIGVVADTHVGEFIPALPPEVLTALHGVDAILHAGDICVPGVLDELAAIAPVLAVRGDHDRRDTARLPRRQSVLIDGCRIGLIHGRRWYPIDIAVTIAHVLTRRRLRWRAGLHRGLRRRLGPVDVIVYGHWHEPDIGRVGDTVIFSPGAVCPWGSLQATPHPRPGLLGLADRLVRRYRRQLPPDAMRPSVGRLEVHAGRLVRAEVIDLATGAVRSTPRFAPAPSPAQPV